MSRSVLKNAFYLRDSATTLPLKYTQLLHNFTLLRLRMEDLKRGRKTRHR